MLHSLYQWTDWYGRFNKMCGNHVLSAPVQMFVYENLYRPVYQNPLSISVEKIVDRFNSISYKIFTDRVIYYKGYIRITIVRLKKSKLLGLILWTTEGGRKFVAVSRHSLFYLHCKGNCNFFLFLDYNKIENTAYFYF